MNFHVSEFDEKLKTHNYTQKLHARTQRGASCEVPRWSSTWQTLFRKTYCSLSTPCLCTSATASLASFPGSTPQLFIAPCINGAIKSWGVESGNEATASPHEYVLGGLEDDVEGIPGEQQEQLHPLPSRLPHLTLGEGGGGGGRGGGRRISPDRNTTQQLLQFTPVNQRSYDKPLSLFGLFTSQSTCMR